MFGHLIGTAILHTVVTFLFSPIGLIVLAVGLLVLGFYLFPTAMPKLLLDVRTWLLAAALVGWAAYAHIQAANKVLQTKLDTVGQAEQAQAGATAALNDRLANMKTTTNQITNLRRIVVSAAAGQKEDSVLDQIAKDDAATNSAAGSPAHSGGLDGVLDGIKGH